MTFGESHGPAVGVVIDGIRPGIALDCAAVQTELDRRRPGGDARGSRRDEPDRVEILSGLFEGRTTGHPIAMIIRNCDARPEDYEALKTLFRPGHADMTWFMKYGIHDFRGGGRSSGRETAARVAAGAVARKVLDSEGVKISAWVEAVGKVRAERFDKGFIRKTPLFCADPSRLAEMTREINEAEKAGDSVGGIVSVLCEKVPAGWGDPVFGKLDAGLAAAMMSIGGVKGVEIGDGFELSGMRASEANDPIGPGFELLSNRCGGILGGISTGSPIRIRLAVKPTPTISTPQQTCDHEGRKAEISMKGRHDPCICPRLVPVAEAMAAVVLADAMENQRQLRE